MTPRRGSSGFTLVEMLLALVLIGMLATFVFGSLRFGTRAWSVAATLSDTQDELGSVQRTLRRLLESALPLTASDEARRPIPSFQGQADGFAFIAAMPAYVSGGGLSVVSLSTEAAEGRRLLVARWGPYYSRPVRAGAAETREVVLTDRLGRLEVGYFGPPARRSPPQWLSEWRNADELPRLVRLRVTLENGQQWPDLVVSPRAAPTP